MAGQTGAGPADHLAGPLDGGLQIGNQSGQLAGGAQHQLLGLLAAAGQGLGELTGTAAGRAAPVPHPRARSSAGDLEATDRGGELADGPAEQPSVGR